MGFCVLQAEGRLKAAILDYTRHPRGHAIGVAIASGGVGRAIVVEA
jgi:hypothetical protein